MITFNSTHPEISDDVSEKQFETVEQVKVGKETVPEFVPQPAPMPAPVQTTTTSNLLIPFLVVSFGMFALGAGGTLIYVNSSSKTAQPAVTVPAEPVAEAAAVTQDPEVREAAPEEQPEETVTRAAATPALFETAKVDVEDPQAREATRAVCAQSLGALLTSGADHLDLARALAREAQGCTMMSITVQGFASHSDDEVENLRASWQQAEDTIATLAAEGLDVSGFRPLGFGSRGQGNDAGPVSFSISTDS